ncbi:MAG: hypothetical protein H6661_03120 [Ardenticatenaceae bacterium]|nr:hypothetical protein [Ardenticatenaceae bacterium]
MPMFSKPQLDDYAFTVRLVGDHRDWKDINFCVHQNDLTEKSAGHYAELLAYRYRNVVEVRYNKHGSLQGHYVPGSEENRRKHREESHAA